MNSEIHQLESRVDQLSLDILGPLRLSKTLNFPALRELEGHLDRLGILLGSANEVPRVLTGKLWIVFCSMLAEAEHATEPDEILNAAWAVQEKLRRIYSAPS